MTMQLGYLDLRKKYPRVLFQHPAWSIAIASTSTQ